MATALGGLAGAALGGILGYQVGDGSSTCAATCVRKPNDVGKGAAIGFVFGAFLGYVLNGAD